MFNETVDLFDLYYHHKANRPLSEKDSIYVARMEEKGELNEAIRVYRRAFHIVRKDFERERPSPINYTKLGDRPGTSNFDNNVYTFNRKRSLSVEDDDDDRNPFYKRRMVFYDPCDSFGYFRGEYETETLHYLIEEECKFLSFIHWKSSSSTLCDFFHRGIIAKNDQAFKLTVWSQYIDYLIFLVIFAKHRVQHNEQYIASLMVKEFLEDEDILATGKFSGSSYVYTYDKKHLPKFNESYWRRKYISYKEREELHIQQLKRQEQETLEKEYSRHKTRKTNICSICGNA